MNKGIDITDKELITSILSGNDSAFKVLYHRYKRNHMLTCLRYIPNRQEAEDVLQEAYISIYNDLYQFDSNRASFKTWSSKVVINRCLKKLRKNTVPTVFQNILDFRYKFIARSSAIENLNIEYLSKVINGLPKGYRTVFNMYVVDGYTHKEIANLLNISESTSKTQLMRAKKLLRNCLNEEEYTSQESYA